MQSKRIGVLLAAAFLFFAIHAPKLGPAEEIELIVEQNPTDPEHFSSIQAAIDRAFDFISTPTGTTNTFAVRVEPGTYAENITLRSNIHVRGRETARTILSGGGTNLVISAANVTNVNITNLSIIDAAIGISITGISSVNVFNNIFRVGTGGTAVQIQGSALPRVVNNTFLQNNIAISSDSDIEIANNIFSGNTNALFAVLPISAFTRVVTNCFHNNVTDGFPFLPSDPNTAGNIPNQLLTNPDPLFVDPFSDPPDMDLHLVESSPCIDQGTNVNGPDSFDQTSRNDIGAYGGPGSDTIPFPVSGLEVLLVSAEGGTVPPTYSVSLAWDTNESYLVTNSTPARAGGYNLYYSLGKSGPPYQNRQNVGNAFNSVIGGLTSASVPAGPVLNEPGFANQTLKLSWSAVPGATDYTVFYTDLGSVDGSEPPLQQGEQSVPAGNTTSFDLTGLNNRHLYRVEVAALAQNQYFIAVTAYNFTVSAQQGGTPGGQHESAFSTETVALVGDPVESSRSNAVTGYPEQIEIVPSLPHKGCFIATAAYGHYSAPQVQTLRDFRDRYLLTNAPGREFVRWYYSFSPAAAQFINEHPAWKPIVRAALLPAVGGAMFMTRASLAIKLTVVLLLGMLIIFLFRKVRRA